MNSLKPLFLVGISLALSTAASAQFSVSGGGSLIPASGSGGDVGVVGDGGALYDSVIPGLEATANVNVPLPVLSISSIEIQGLTHTWVGDLLCTLEDPTGIEHLIWVRPGFLNTSNFGSSGDLVGGTYTFIESGAAALPTTSGSAGNVLPGTYDQSFSTGGTTWGSGTGGIFNTALSSISGPAGTWTLHIYDWGAGDSGSFSGWTLNGMESGGSAGDGELFAIRGTGQGVSYNWEVQTSLNVFVASGSETTGFGATATQMRDQIVAAIDGAALGLEADPGGWTPGGSWSPFELEYKVLGVVTPIKLLIDGCNTNLATLALPCQFNPEIASDAQIGIGLPYCFGDGTGSACPCAANGGSGEGCLTTSGTGATLTGSGSADVLLDIFVLSVTGGPANKPGIFFQGTNAISVPLADGIFCTNASMRYAVNILDGAGSTSQTGFGAFASSSSTLYYQYWFRDPSNPCSGQGFNFTNGWALTWE